MSPVLCTTAPTSGRTCAFLPSQNSLKPATKRPDRYGLPTFEASIGAGGMGLNSVGWVRVRVGVACARARANVDRKRDDKKLPPCED